MFIIAYYLHVALSIPHLPEIKVGVNSLPAITIGFSRIKMVDFLQTIVKYSYQAITVENIHRICKFARTQLVKS